MTSANNFTEAELYETEKNCLAVRHWLDTNGLSAFTVNFLDISAESVPCVVPFLEASKAMARGMGYAGEGDVMTASLVGALQRGFGSAAFVEIFCPDWKNNTLFLSHMGEANLALAGAVPLMHRHSFPYTDAEKPVVPAMRYRKGNAVFINLFRHREDYRLFVSPVTMEEPGGADNFDTSNRGWMRPTVPVAEFLERISTEGCTHHSALIYDTTAEAVEYFGRLLGLKVIRLG